MEIYCTDGYHQKTVSILADVYGPPTPHPLTTYLQVSLSQKNLCISLEFHFHFGEKQK